MSELKINQSDAIRILKNKLLELESDNFNGKVWEDRTVLDIEQIFGKYCQQRFQVLSIHLGIYEKFNNKEKLRDGKRTAHQLIASYIDYIIQYSSPQSNVPETNSSEQIITLAPVRERISEVTDKSVVEMFQEIKSMYEQIKANQSSSDRQKNDESKSKESYPLRNQKHGFDISGISDLPPYIRITAESAIKCFEIPIYESFLASISKLLRLIIIEILDEGQHSHKIISNDNLYLNLSSLTDIVTKEPSFQLTIKMKNSLHVVMKYLELSTNNRRLIINEGDILYIKDDLSRVLSELIQLFKIKSLQNNNPT